MLSCRVEIMPTKASLHKSNILRQHNLHKDDNSCAYDLRTVRNLSPVQSVLQKNRNRIAEGIWILYKWITKIVQMHLLTYVNQSNDVCNWYEFPGLFRWETILHSGITLKKIVLIQDGRRTAYGHTLNPELEKQSCIYVYKTSPKIHGLT